MWFDNGVIMIGALLAAVVSGSTGFAFALIGMAIWLHVMPPTRAVPLVVLCSILLNLVFVWRLRHDVSFKRLAPFLAGAVLGVPLGVLTLHSLDPVLLRHAVGALLLVYSGYMLMRTHMPIVSPNPAIAHVLDGGVGMLGGFMGGSTGLNGLLPTLWSGLRGWNKEMQRGVFQTYILMVHAYTLAWLGGVGGISHQTIRDLVLCLPALVLGGFIGLKLFNRTSEKGFRRLILWLFVLSGVTLLA
jgi:uncharacterized membrane protein YfcA